MPVLPATPLHGAIRQEIKMCIRDREKPAAFSELFQQNPNNLLPAAFHALDAQPVDLTQAAESSLHAVVHLSLIHIYMCIRDRFKDSWTRLPLASI